MSIATPQSPPKIDVAASVCFAYAVAIDHWRLVVALAWAPFVVVTMAGEAYEWLGDSWLVRTAYLLIDSGGFAIFIVRWHRFVLLGETAADRFIPAGWGPYIWTTMKLGLLLLIGFVLLLVIVSFAIGPSLTSNVTAGVGVIAAIVLGLALFWAGVSLAFPAAAIGRRISLVTGAWDLVSGNYWRLVACLVACCAPFALLSFGVGSLGGWSPILRFVAFIIQSTVWFAGAAVVASLLSQIYRRLAPTEAEAGTPA
jgi:hypothetical protein